MVSLHYIRSTMFIFDLLSTIPIAEIASIFDEEAKDKEFSKWFK